MLFREHLRKNKVDREMAKIMLLIAEKSKLVRRAFLTHSGISATKNIHGERQMELDKYADQVFLNAMERSKLVRTVASEEQDEIVEIVKARGNYGVTLDPLDGSSLIKSNLAVGTIAGFFNEGNVMEKGSKMDGAMYILYGPLTTLVYTAKKGVHQFVLNRSNLFELKKQNIKIPNGKLYSPGGLRKDWVPKHAKFISAVEKQGYKLRFSGGFVPDFQLILDHGGIFSYPSLKTNQDGKLRLIFEANPMGLIAKEAGGDCSNGFESLHNIKPKSLSQRTPLYVGGKKEIKLVEKYFRKK